MRDWGHKKTDAMLDALERRITKEYAQAVKEVDGKVKDYLEKFQIKDKTKQDQLKRGVITQKEYKDWRIGQIMTGTRWQALRDEIAHDFHRTNQLAKKMTQDGMIDIYALNHNFGTYLVELGAKVDTSYTLYNRDVVKRILTKNPDLLPPPGKRVSRRIMQGLDVRWNRQQVQSVMLQGILQGKSIPDIATHLAETVGDRDRKAAIRNARTMTTGAENAGRIDSFNRASEMGIKQKKVWMATLDNRTRESHRELDGEERDIDEPFSNGLMYPGDPTGDPGEVYNCRCTMLQQFEGFETDLFDTSQRNTDHFDYGSYEAWERGHAESKSITEPEERAQEIRESYIREYMR